MTQMQQKLTHFLLLDDFVCFKYNVRTNLLTWNQNPDESVVSHSVSFQGSDYMDRSRSDLI